MNEKLTAYALNELPPDERAELEAQMKDDSKLREEAEAMKAFCAMLETEVSASAEDTLDPEQRNKLVQTFQSTETKIIRPPLWRRPIFFNGLGLAAAACVALMFVQREIREASQQAEVQQLHGPFSYKVIRSEPTPAAKVKRATTSSEPDALEMVPDMAFPPASKISSSAVPSPVPATPPLVGSGPLAPTDSMKIKEEQNHLWFDHAESRTGNGTLTLNSPGTAGTASSVTTSDAATASPGHTDPTLVANSAGTLTESKTRQRKFVAQTANPAVDVNGNPPASSLRRATGKEYTDGTTINAGTLDVTGSLASTDAPDAAKKVNPTATPADSFYTSSGVNGAALTPSTTANSSTLSITPPADRVKPASKKESEWEKAHFVADNGTPRSPKMLNRVNSGLEGQVPIKAQPIDGPSAAPVAGGRSGNAATSPDSIDGLVPNKSLVASTDTAKKEAPAKDLDALEKQNAELKKQIEEMNTHSYQFSVQEAQRRVLQEKILRDRLATERLQREARQRSFVEQRVRYSGYNTATYRPIIENPFSFTSLEPLSTFSTDVDTASYANARRFLNANQRPPPDAIRLEELINYFPYNYPAPEDDKPLAVKVDIGEAPWQPLHRLARIAIKAREVKNAERPAANFTFLLDVSGSMSPPERLPLVKMALRLLVEQLREDDRVSIVTYAGESGVALESTPGNEKERILNAINALSAGGSTNGASGIRMAYEQAVSHYKKDGINRVILCTDGDFNVGTSNVEDLKVLITEKAKTGVFLSVLGVGTDNLHDFTMATLADCGNGNYHYLDSMSEARKVLVEQMTGNMITVAKDVKIQVEFNPAQVAAYRLIGYEKRMLEKEDFNNDKKDAGDIGAGHTITALYEIVPADLKYPDGQPLVDDLKYNKPAAAAAAAPAPPAKEEAPSANREIMTVKLRYKEPTQDKSKLMVLPVTDTQKKLSENDRALQFATSVAGFGMLLRGSPYGNDLTWDTVRQLALSGKGEDTEGWRGEFIQLIEKARGICEEVR